MHRRIVAWHRTVLDLSTYQEQWCGSRRVIGIPEAREDSMFYARRNVGAAASRGIDRGWPCER